MTFRVFVLTVILCLTSFFAGTVKAGELDDLVATKQVEYVGLCRFDKNDVLIFRNGDDVKSVQCVVGIEPHDPHDLKYVLVFHKNEPMFLLEYSMVRKAQRLLWKRPSI